MNLDGLKVLMISTDRNILAQDSPVSKRMKEYGKLAEELHIVVMSDKAHSLKETKIASNIWIYPTNSSFKFLRPRNATKLGKKIVYDNKFVRGQSLITTQDPFECGWAGLRVKKKWRIPLEVQLHTDPFSPHFTGSLNKIRQKLAKKVIPQADSIRVVSESLKSLLLTTYLSRAVSRGSPPPTVSVLPLYVDKERVESATLTFDLHARFGWQFVLLTVSRLTEEKNLPLALHVLALLHQRYPSIGLVIVGSGPEEDKLKKLAKELGVERNIAFEGWQDKLASYYKSANAYLQTSYFEGYGVSVVEAGLSGLPVVTSPVGIANDLEDGKELYICPQGDADYFANAIADLIENNQKRQNLAMNMKGYLDEHLLSKEDYLNKLKKNWEETAKSVSSKQ